MKNHNNNQEDNMDKSLLIDVITFEPVKDILQESISNSGKKPFIVKGVLQRANTKNQNGRIYPKEILIREAQKYTDNFIRERRALGELDHPQEQVVNLKNVSHNIVEMHWDGDDLVGTIEILGTPSGNILKSLFESNIRLGVSSRALGSLKKISEGSELVNDDLEVICWDFVSNPSVRGAFVYPEQQTISEGVVNNQLTNRWSSVEAIIHDILTEIS